MHRRSLLAAAASPLLPAAAAGQALPLVGVLRVNPRSTEAFTDGFRRDMARLGFDEGRQWRLEVVFADGENSRLPALAAGLVEHRPRALVAFGNPGVAAVQAATREIPIVGMADDLTAVGLVASMARPGGNTTGVSIMGHELDLKRLEVLHEIAPTARRIGVVLDTTTGIAGVADRLQAAAARLGLALTVVRAEKPDEIAPAFAALEAAKVEAVQCLASPFLNAQRGRFIEHARTRRLPAIYEWPETVDEGGLASYGPRQAICFRHVAVLVSKLLHGARPADLPVEQPTTFTFALNSGAAKAIGLQLASDLLLRADLVVD